MALKKEVGEMVIRELLEVEARIREEIERRERLERERLERSAFHRPVRPPVQPIIVVVEQRHCDPTGHIPRGRKYCITGERVPYGVGITTIRWGPKKISI